MSVFVPILLVALAVGGVLFFYYSRRRLRRKFAEQLKLKLFLIRLPRGRGKEERDVRQEIGLSEQLFAALAAFGGPFVFEVAVPYVGEEIHFYAAVPGSFAEVLTKQVQSLWSDAEVAPADDYNIFNYSGVAAGAVIRQKERFIIPIRTYAEQSADTFLPLLGGLAKVNEVGEGAALQYIVASAGAKAEKRVRSALRVLKKGWKLKDVLEEGFAPRPSEVTEALAPPSKEARAAEKVIDEQAVKALEMKLSKRLYEVNVRVMTSAPSQFQANAILDGIVAGFSQFGAPGRNDFKIVRPRNLGDLVQNFSFRAFNSAEAMVLSGEELASLFHFPTSTTAIPKVKYLKAREAAPPAELPAKGILLGESVYRGERRPARLAEDDRRRHLYLVGQTGTGKSTLLTHLAIQDIAAGHGAAIVDPHGELVDTILSLVPPARAADVLVFDPSDVNRPLGLNMIEYDPARPEQKTFIVNEMVGIFDKLYDLKATGGPMFEQYMRNALLLLMEDAPAEPATLMEVSRVFTDHEFRARKLRRIRNPTVIDFWEKEAVKAGGEAALANMTPYITSKFAAFTANDYMRVIVGQVTSAFNFREVMDKEKILIVNLAKGRIGEANASLLGMIIVGKILMAALSRTDLPEGERKDFYLYIDEFQNFTTDSIASILSEARKYRLNLTLAHQFVGQLTEKIRDAVFGNVGSMVAFRVGVKDAETLAKQFAPVFSEEDLVNIDNFNAYVKLLIRGETTRPFNIKTFPPALGDVAQGREFKERSRTQYGRDREDIERDILRRLRG